jgi:hypothetical protein
MAADFGATNAMARTSDWLVVGFKCGAGRLVQIHAVVKAANKSHADRVAAELAEATGSAVVLSSSSGPERPSFRVEAKYGPMPKEEELRALVSFKLHRSATSLQRFAGAPSLSSVEGGFVEDRGIPETCGPQHKEARAKRV